MNGKRNLILGITGQDGSYLAEQLLATDAEVHGVIRRSSNFNRERIEHLRQFSNLSLHYADITDTTSLRRIIQKVQPDRIFNLAGQSHVGLSFEIPELTINEVANATLGLLEICRDVDQAPRVYLAGSSEIFGCPVVTPQTEDCPHLPTSPYGCAKSMAFHMARVYRESFGLFVSNGIAYNHESPRRSPNFVTRKISMTVSRIANGSSEILELGNLDAVRDWGYAPEYVQAMVRILDHSNPGDYILATGTNTSVREFATSAFAAAGMEIEFEGTGEGETGRVNGNLALRINPRFYRPLEPQSLIGDAGKAASELGWKATTIGRDVAAAMVQAEPG